MTKFAECFEQNIYTDNCNEIINNMVQKLTKEHNICCFPNSPCHYETLCPVKNKKENSGKHRKLTENGMRKCE